jgi:hypothetical protein
MRHTAQPSGGHHGGTCAFGRLKITTHGKDGVYKRYWSPLKGNQTGSSFQAGVVPFEYEVNLPVWDLELQDGAGLWLSEGATKLEELEKETIVV